MTHVAGRFARFVSKSERKSMSARKRVASAKKKTSVPTVVSDATPRHLALVKPTMLMKHNADPADVIKEEIGDLSEIEMFGNQILLGVYERPEQLASGVYMSDQTRQEDQYQGKVGLVLKKGPAAFRSDSNYDFMDQNVKVGEWVVLWVTDGRKIRIKGMLCRVVEDLHIRMKISAPDIVY